MNVDMNTIRFLGAAQLFVFAASLLSNQLLKSVVGSGDISDALVNISENISRMRISTLVALLNCIGIVILGVLFYIVLNEQNKILALVALGCFLAEGITLAVSKIGAYGLISLSQEFVAAGAPESSYFQTLGDFHITALIKRDTTFICCFSVWVASCGIPCCICQDLFHRHYQSGALQQPA